MPDSSSGYVDAQVARIRCLSEANGAGGPVLDDLFAAGSILESLPLDADQRERLTADILSAVLRLASTGVAFDDGGSRLLGHRLVDRELRLGLERSYRSLARRAGSRSELIDLVDQANRTRPRMWT